MEYAPEDGDVTVNYFWPSGSKLELQIYFKSGEHIKTVLDRLFESEGISCAILPDILRIVGDIFLFENRNPLKKLHSPGAFPTSVKNQENLLWKSYSKLFENAKSLSSLLEKESELANSLKRSAEIRKNLLITEELRYASELAGLSSEDHQISEINHKRVVDAIEKEFLSTQGSVKQEFWRYVDSAEIIKNKPSSELSHIIENKPSKKPFINEITISLGAQSKRKFLLGISYAEDVCDIPIIPTHDNQSHENVDSESLSDIQDSTIHLSHPENIYKRYITTLVLPYSYQDSHINIAPELIRSSEEIPELHFDSIRSQISNAEQQNNDQIIFTKHSNIKGLEGVFHVPENKL